MHLLIVEDERTLCDTVARSLRRSAYSVDCCYDGEKALELLETERYDLVLLDLNLPGADGLLEKDGRGRAKEFPEGRTDRRILPAEKGRGAGALSGGD